jgi:hypothetical protein
MKPIKAWIGLCEGKVDYCEDPTGSRFLACFKTRKEAREWYVNIIRVEIREVKGGRE